MHRTITSFAPRAARVFAFAALAVGALAPAAWATQVTFRYQPVIGGVQSVSVAGTFNGWNATDTPLADADKDGVWEKVIDLPAGRIEYKFVVNGDQWMTDEGAAEFSPDGFGGQNSVLVLGNDPVVVGTGSTVKKIEAPKFGLRRVIFKFRPEGEPQKVSLAGTFNDWTVGKTPMADPDGDGEYAATVLLAPGSYQYKFVVGDNTWIQDTKGQDADTDDGYGGKNSILNVDDRFPSISVKRGDGQIYPDGLQHAQGANEINNRGGGKVEFTTRAHLDDIDGVDLVTWSAGREAMTPMHPVNRDKIFQYYRADLTMPPGETPYLFRYRDGAKSLYLAAGGLRAAPDSGRFVYSAARFPEFITPDWVKNGVIYQIFPDRFRNGNPSNDPDFKEWYYQGKTALPAGGSLNTDFQEYYHLVKDWNDYQGLTHSPWTKDGRDWMAFYGGDIEGVRQKLDYLQDLGVTILYFNPLFQAKSTHKYDAADYRKIDPHFASNEEFIAFVKEAKTRGIRIILDIVYNHSGNSNWAFKDAAEKGTKSSYYQWYEFKKWPLPDGWPNVGHAWKPADYYYCWWGFGDLPDFNFDLSRKNDAENAIKDITQAQVNVPLVDYLLETTEYWIKTVDADGVRLDVPNEVPYWFWKVFNERVKKAKPDAYIVGELWGNASDYVRPGVYDAVMNYAFFRDAVQRFLGMGQGSAAEFDASLATGRLAYPSQAVEVQMNLIDSHDTVRFLTQVGGNANRLKLAAMFAMTYVGAPTIYYGDEIGMEGGKDPDCRRPFVWSWEKEPARVALHDYYRSLTKLRHAHPALRTGNFTTLSTAGLTYAYRRSGGGEDFVVVLNAGKQDATVTIDTAPWGGKVDAADMLAGKSEPWSGAAQVGGPAETGRIFQLTRKR
ncbi:MAG: hypothetical protein A2V63_06905 [Candidatus Eisenbacteria bacterium RBG_19FT_COMBO_70_11]|nr:MAG: hypothetical protein A2V63_06905 [Candidatus Eisenbacteria bacterium RBG_19FT_COMBO_70_11]